MSGYVCVDQIMLVKIVFLYGRLHEVNKLVKIVVSEKA